MPIKLTIGNLTGTVTIDALLEGFCLEGANLNRVELSGAHDPEEAELYQEFDMEFRRLQSGSPVPNAMPEAMRRAIWNMNSKRAMRGRGNP